MFSLYMGIRSSYAVEKGKLLLALFTFSQQIEYSMSQCTKYIKSTNKHLGANGFFSWAENNLNISSVNNRAFCVLSSKYFENEDNKYRSEQRKNASVIGLSKVDIQI